MGWGRATLPMGDALICKRDTYLLRPRVRVIKDRRLTRCRVIENARRVAAHGQSPPSPFFNASITAPPLFILVSFFFPCGGWEKEKT